MTISRIVAPALIAGLCLMTSACVFAPERPASADSVQIQTMADQALKTCGAGNVKDVNPRSFTCK